MGQYLEGGISPTPKNVAWTAWCPYEKLPNAKTERECVDAKQGHSL